MMTKNGANSNGDMGLMALNPMMHLIAIEFGTIGDPLAQMAIHWCHCILTVTPLVSMCNDTN